jgi:hypothetical protein
MDGAAGFAADAEGLLQVSKAVAARPVRLRLSSSGAARVTVNGAEVAALTTPAGKRGSEPALREGYAYFEGSKQRCCYSPACFMCPPRGTHSAKGLQLSSQLTWLRACSPPCCRAG